MESENIPIVDLSKLLEVENIAEDPEWKATSKNVRNGLGAVGFMYLTNHGIPVETVCVTKELIMLQHQNLIIIMK